MNRRDFLQTAAAGTASLLLGDAARAQKISLPRIKSTFNGVVIGCNTYSLPELPFDQALAAIAEIGFGLCEIHPRHLEPFFGRGSSARAENREKLRQWRLSSGIAQSEAFGKKVKQAGLYLYAYNCNYQHDMTDAELERTFEMTRAMGARVITAAGDQEGRELTRRLDPLARKYKIRVGLHNHASSIRGEADYDAALKGLSEYMAMTLDIGHYVSANADPVPLLRKRHDDIVALHIKDRRRNGGSDMPFGQGDTPIKEVLALLRENKWTIPANIEWEIAGPDRVEAVRRSFEYCKQALLA
ncbi:MAG: sugar phosphate isomerase/epimerase [Acidobacteria bacterium]|nr:sugar phosphate isomerase/epimerase [Acidobacteriota bacterium]